jgi:hypothetical protein
MAPCSVDYQLIDLQPGIAVFGCTSLNAQPLCNGREEALHFLPQIRDCLAIT